MAAERRADLAGFLVSGIISFQDFRQAGPGGRRGSPVIVSLPSEEGAAAESSARALEKKFLSGLSPARHLAACGASLSCGMAMK